MTSDWKEYRLGDVTEWASGGTPSKKNEAFWNGSIPWISASSMSGNRYSDSALMITEAGLRAGSRLAEKNSILLLVRGSTLHQRILVGITERDVAFNQDVKSIKPKKEYLDSWYLLFWLMSIEKELLNMVENTGIGAGKLDTKLLQKLIIKIPPKEERERIKACAKAIDDKLILNRQTNQTLEQITQAIFKSWFVDFEPVKAKIQAKRIFTPTLSQREKELIVERAVICAISGKSLEQLEQLSPETQQQLETTAALFPDTLVESELGEIPEGWEVKTFGDVSQCFDSKRIPLSKKKREEKKPGNIPYYGATSRMDYINEWIFDDIYLLLGEDGSVIKEDGTPFIQFIWGKAWVNNHAHVLQGKNGVSTEQLMLFIQSQNIAAYITGAVQLKLNQGNMNSIPFLDSGESLNKMFYNFIEPPYKTIRLLIEENQSLTELRDTLLPKLLSGELTPSPTAIKENAENAEKEAIGLSNA